MRSLKESLYNFLLYDFANKHISHTKFWSNVGYLAMTWAFCHVIYVGETSVDYMLWLLFGVVVVGNKTLRDYIKKPPSP